ncbi:hypothetical protein [Thermococcus sp. JCM 11816]|uniref:hypothetical protein n=1 Tax=Thermococcus sp. (strain JCM 11816 / KS-1) TaxID=1295125 RepID=UPI0034650A3F
MDVITLVVLLIGIVVAVGISAFLVSRMMQSYTREIYQVLESTIAESRSVAPVQTAPEVTEGANESELKLKTPPQKTKVTKNEEELLEQLRSIINERMGEDTRRGEGKEEAHTHSAGLCEGLCPRIRHGGRLQRFSRQSAQRA